MNPSTYPFLFMVVGMVVAAGGVYMYNSRQEKDEDKYDFIKPIVGAGVLGLVVGFVMKGNGGGGVDVIEGAGVSNSGGAITQGGDPVGQTHAIKSEPPSVMEQVLSGGSKSRKVPNFWRNTKFGSAPAPRAGMTIA